MGNWRMPSWTWPLLCGSVVSVVAVLAVRYLLPSAASAAADLGVFRGPSALVAAVVAVPLLVASRKLLLEIYRYNRVLAKQARPEIPASRGWIADALWLIAVLALLYAIPAAIIRWVLAPLQYAKAIRLGVFLLSVGIGTLYFLFHIEDFPRTTDKVTYFAALCSIPLVVDYLL